MDGFYQVIQVLLLKIAVLLEAWQAVRLRIPQPYFPDRFCAIFLVEDLLSVKVAEIILCRVFQKQGEERARKSNL